MATSSAEGRRLAKFSSWVRRGTQNDSGAPSRIDRVVAQQAKFVYHLDQWQWTQPAHHQLVAARRCLFRPAVVRPLGAGAIDHIVAFPVALDEGRYRPGQVQEFKVNRRDHSSVARQNSVGRAISLPKFARQVEDGDIVLGRNQHLDLCRFAILVVIVSQSDAIGLARQARQWDIADD